jgi:hypothetical protein
LELDGDEDGVPDGWYNLRDAARAPGGVGGGRWCLRFECPHPGRPARASRAFGIDGRKTEALVVSVWVKAIETGAGERAYEIPGLILDFLDADLKTAGRRQMGPWTADGLGREWTRVSARLDVPESTRDAIMTLGLLGARGILEIDRLEIREIAIGGERTTNLIWNGGFDLGDPDPDGWVLEGDAKRRVSLETGAAYLHLGGLRDRAIVPIAGPLPVSGELRVEIIARWSGLRSNAAGVALYFIDRDGRSIDSATRPLWRFSGSAESHTAVRSAAVASGAAGAVLQFERFDAGGVLRVDEVRVTAAPDARVGEWKPGHVELSAAERWPDYAAAESIEPGSALDGSLIVKAAGERLGPFVVREGGMVDSRGRSARFFGLALLPPLAFAEPADVDRLVERLARSGVNHVHLSDFDSATGPGESLYDDSRDDTLEFDAEGMRRFDRLTATLGRFGISYSFALLSHRQFRKDDGISFELPRGAGPAAGFDAFVRGRIIESARKLAEHRNSETGIALRDDPHLAWISLTCEQTLFDLEGSASLPRGLDLELQSRVAKVGGTRVAAWRAIESAQWSEVVDALRQAGWRVPVAGCSHWRRESDFCAAQRGSGISVIDDELFWSSSPFIPADRRALQYAAPSALSDLAGKKRTKDRAYVVSAFATNPDGRSALPYEGGDLLLAAWAAATGDWDALVRRGVLLFPRGGGRVRRAGGRECESGGACGVAPCVVDRAPAISLG